MVNAPPPPYSAKKSQQFGGPIFRQNRFSVTWNSVLGPKHTFLYVAMQLESCGDHLKNNLCLGLYMVLEQRYLVVCALI